MNRIAQHVKDYWPVWGIVVAVATALTTYIGLPKRVEQVEAGQQTLEETFNGYLQAQKDALSEQRGYQKALNERVLQQQAPVPAVRLPEPEPILREFEEGVGYWCCKVAAEWRQWCFDYDQWYRCD